MGILGLLKELKPVTVNRNIKDYRKKRIAIDGYAWLHKATFGCCVELATGTECTKWILYCLKLIDMLLFHDIDVHMVFDGANLPAKDGVEKVRAESRKTALESGLKLLSSDKKSERDLARGYLAKAIDVTPFMAGQLIQVLREQRPQVVPSQPYTLSFCRAINGCSRSCLSRAAYLRNLMSNYSSRYNAQSRLMRPMRSFPISAEKVLWMLL